MNVPSLGNVVKPKLGLYSVISQVAKAGTGQKYWESEVCKILQVVIH